MSDHLQSPSSVDSTSLSHDSREYLFVDGTECHHLKDGKTHSRSASDTEPKLGRTVDTDQGISELIAEAQMDDYITDYYQEDSEPLSTFHKVTYLGTSVVNDPTSEVELYKTMAILGADCSVEPIEVVATVKNEEFCLLDSNLSTSIASFKLENICCWARGKDERNGCFALNITHGVDEPIFQCHVFKCKEDEEIEKLEELLEAVVKKQDLSTSSKDGVGFEFRFNVTLDLWEEDGKGSYQVVARDKNHFKLRKELQRKVVMIFEQPTEPKIKFQRCFGLLLAQGGEVPDQEMHLLQQVSIDHRPSGKVIISGHWNPQLEQWKMLNTDTGKDNRIFMTVAVDVVLAQLQEPVRFVKKVKVRVFPTNEKFWNPSKPRIQEQYLLNVLEKYSESGTRYFIKENLLSLHDIEKAKALSWSSRPLSVLWRSGSASGRGVLEQEMKRDVVNDLNEKEDVVFEQVDENNDDDDEPLLSGTGMFPEEYSEEHIAHCEEILQQWEKSNERPSATSITTLVKLGFPDSLRAKLWELLIGLEEESDLRKSYEYLIEKESPQEQVILWDVTRTFPGHEFFKNAGGEGQKALYNVSKAYSIYDEEVGYCQGLSFLVAVLLLHVPEDTAYCMLVKMMYQYGHRDQFKDGFEMLHQSFYVLDQLIQENLPDLNAHFQNMNIEVHMFASQWFLTLFTVKFPLPLVYKIMDLILCQGCDVSFQFALALLKDSSKELLSLNFEGILKHFRVGLPKRYTLEENINRFIDIAYSFKISKKKLQTYKQNYIQLKADLAAKEDPITHLQRENQHLIEENLRLERENDHLAFEIVTTQVSTQETILDREEKVNSLTKETERMKNIIMENKEEIMRLNTEESRVKEMWRESTNLADTAKAKRDRIITDYKQILTQLESRHEDEQRDLQNQVSSLKNQISTCERCSEYLNAPTHPLQQTVESTAASVSSKELRDVEAELIATKMALAEERNRADEIEIKLRHVVAAAERPWYKKVAINNKR